MSLYSTAESSADSPKLSRGSVEVQPGQGERRESTTHVRLDGDETTADADDGDAGHSSGTYMT
jgi:hypothetical protein